MKVFLQLMKITSSSVEPSIDEKKRSKAFSTVMSIIILFLIFIPVTVFVGFIVYALTNALTAYENIGIVPLGLSLMLHIVSVFSLVFGFNVILSVFYFSSDLDYLLPLPVSPMKIVGAKFTSTMLSENIMEGILVLGALVGFLFGYRSNINIVSILSAMIGIITFPIVPLSYCAIICMVLMYFSRFIKNKDNVSKITAFSTVVLLVALIIFLNLSGGFDPELFAHRLLNGDLGVFNVLNVIFFQVRFLSAAVAGDILSLLIYILINAVSFGVVLALSCKLYFKAVVSLNGGQGKTSEIKAAELDKAIKSSSHLSAYFKKELKILVRTPAYLMNCVGINLIWPIFIYLFVILQKQSNFLGDYIDKLKSGDSDSALTLILTVFGVSVILTALNCLASSAITREGKHFEVMRYMPVDLMTQLNSKALVSIVISGAGLVIYIISAFIIFGISPLLIAYSVVLSIACVVFTAYLGIYLDTINPKLVWEDEINALRGNYHVFFNMAIAIIITAVIFVGMKLLFKFNILPFAAILIAILVLTVILSLSFYALCKTKGIKNLLKIEM